MNIDCNHHVASFDYNKAVENEYHPLVDQPLFLEDKSYTFEYSYPLCNCVAFNHPITRAMSVIDILLLARRDYERIYQEEEAVTGTADNIPGLLNRNLSHGPHGIWGHHISDLYFEQVIIKDNTINFSIGS
jgi:hypothetical protein